MISIVQFSILYKNVLIKVKVNLSFAHKPVILSLFKLKIKSSGKVVQVDAFLRIFHKMSKLIPHFVLFFLTMYQIQKPLLQQLLSFAICCSISTTFFLPLAICYLLSVTSYLLVSLSYLISFSFCLILVIAKLSSSSVPVKLN